MQRRDVIRLLGGALALPALHGLAPEEAWGLGRDLHRALLLSPRAGRVLNDEQMRTTAAIVERIIPQTDTPGAAAARVHEFIDLLLADWYDDAGRTRFLDGLVQIDARSHVRHGVPFASLTEAQQAELLLELDAEVQALRAAELPSENHFFQQMKWLTVFGYYTSEAGMKEELRWVPIAGGYDPCRPFAPRTVGGL